MKKLEENNDQEINDVQATVDLEDLQADLETKLGDGELFEHDGGYYYAPESGGLYEVDFDTQDTEKWMQGAVKKPGALHESLGISKDKEIPMSLINSKIAELHKKSEGDKKLSPEDKKLLERLIFAKNAKSISKKKDFTKNEEDSDSDDPLTHRTDSVDESCPLSKNKNKKSANNMKKVEKQADVYSEEEDKKKSMVDEEEEEDKTKDTVEEKKEDMKKEDVKTPEPPKIEDFAPLIEDLVQKKVDELTKDIKEEQERIKNAKINELKDLLQKEPYGYATEDLEGQCIKDLEKMKSIIEGSKLYKDFQDAQKKIEDPMEINKEIFDSVEDMNPPISDPWRSFKTSRGGK